MSQEYERVTRLGAQILPRRHQHDLLPSSNIHNDKCCNLSENWTKSQFCNLVTLCIKDQSTKINRKYEDYSKFESLMQPSMKFKDPAQANELATLAAVVCCRRARRSILCFNLCRVLASDLGGKGNVVQLTSQPTNFYFGTISIWSSPDPTFEIIVESVNEVSAGAEIYQSNLLRSRVDQDILVLYVPVEHPAVVTKENCLKNLRNLIVEKLFLDFFWTIYLGK